MDAARSTAKPREIHWVEVDEWNNGHGVQFRHDEFPRECIAFLKEFGWLDGGPATVTLLAVRPRSIAIELWPAIVQNALDAVVAFLSTKENAKGDFRQGKVFVVFNA
jgi:hypothetical protein